MVRGNHEFYYLDYGTERAQPGRAIPAGGGSCTGSWRITPEQGQYLGMLPDDRTLYLPGAQPLRVTHGVPGRNRWVSMRSSRRSRSRLNWTARASEQLFRRIPMCRWIGMSALDAGNGESYGDPHSSRTIQPSVVRRRWHVINPEASGFRSTRTPGRSLP